MRRRLLLLIIVFGFLTSFSQKVTVQMEPEIVGGKFRAVFTIDNRLYGGLAPADLTIESFIDSTIVDFSSMALAYTNPKWSPAVYKPINLAMAAVPSNDVFVLLLTSESLADPAPGTAILALNQKDTLAVVEFDLFVPCNSVTIPYAIQSVSFIKWYTFSPDPVADDITPNVIFPIDTLNYNSSLPPSVLNSSASSICSAGTPINFQVNGFPPAIVNDYNFEYFHFDGSSTNSVKSANGDTLFNSNLISSGDSVFVIITDLNSGCKDTTNAINFATGSLPSSAAIFDENSNLVSGTTEKECIGYEYIRAVITGGSIDSVQWLYGKNVLVGETLMDLNGVSSGSYSYIYYSGGCSDTSDVFNLQIWPTPLVDNFNSNKTVLCGIDTAMLTINPIEGGGLVLDGVGDYMDGGNSATFGFSATQSFTIEGVVLRTAVGSNSGVFQYLDASNRGYRLTINGNDDLVLFVGNGGATKTFISTNSSIPTDFKRHVAVVVDRKKSAVRFYVNGLLTDEFIDPIFATAFVPINTTARIGNTFTGIIDEVRLWNAALSIENINTLRTIPINGALGTLPPFLVGYWHMDDNVNLIAGNSSTLVGDAKRVLGKGFFKPSGSLYTWSGPAGFFSANNDTVYTTLPGTYNVTVDNSVCFAQSNNLAIGGVVIQDVLPSDTTVCNAPISLTGPNGINLAYTWTNSGGASSVSGASTQNYTYTPLPATTVTDIYLNVVSPSGCSDRDTITVNFINALTIPDTAAGYALIDTAFMSWNAVNGATQYRVSSYPSASVPSTKTYVNVGLNTDYKFNKTIPGVQEWTFELVALGPCGSDTVFSRVLIGECINLPYTTIGDSAWTTFLTDSLVSFTWNPSGLATFYDVQVKVNNVITQPWVNNGSTRSFTVNGLSYGDIVCFNYRARTSCDMAEAVERCVVAFNCNADFTGLRDTTQHYCTSSFKDLIEPDSVNNIVGSYFFTGDGVLYGNDVWYFDPQVASPGLHNVTMIGCYGADTVSKPVVVLPSPCTEIVDSKDISIPFKIPQGIYTDCDGQIYFTDPDNHGIIKIDTFGVGALIVGTQAGSHGFIDGHSSIALAYKPSSLIVHPITKEVYFSDGGNHSIRKYNPADSVVTTLVGGGSALGSVGSVGATEYGDHDDLSNFALNKMFNQPKGLAFNATFDTIYISDFINEKIKALSLVDNSIITITGQGVGNGGTVDGPFASATVDKPAQLKFDETSNRLYVGSEALPAANIRYLDFTTGQVTTLNTGGPGFTLIDGPLTSSTHLSLIDVAADGQGNLFMLDFKMCALRVYKKSTNTVTSILGTLNGESSKCGSGSTTDLLNGTIRLNEPSALSVYVNGFVDLVDTKNNRVLRVAIDDFINSPNRNLDTLYCATDAIDTLNVNTVAGFYSASRPGFVSDNGTHWVFNPKADTGYVTVYFNHTIGACQGAESKEVYVAPMPALDLGNDTLFCVSNFGVDSIKVDSTYAAYQWAFKPTASATYTVNTADTNYYKVVTAEGAYALTVSSEFGCTISDTLVITPRPAVNLSFASTNGNNLCYGDSTRLTIDNTIATDPALIKFNWMRGDTTQTIAAKVTGDYVVEVEDVLGCVAADTFRLQIQNRPYAVIKVDTTLKNQTNDAFYGEWVAGMLPVSVSRPWDIQFLNNGLFVTEDTATIFGTIHYIDLSDTSKIQLAGGGTLTTNPVLRTSALLQGLKGLAIDSTGIYFTQGHQIKVLRGDSIYVVAGTVAAGNVTGNASIAQFNEPRQLILDGFGNLLVADYRNNSIKQISLIDSSVSVLVGDVLGTAGLVNGVGENASLNLPWGISRSVDGNLFVTNEYGNAITQINLDTLATVVVNAATNDGTTATGGFTNSTINAAQFATNARVQKPWNIETDAEGNQYFVDRDNFSVRVLTPQDSVVTIANFGSSSANLTGISYGRNGVLYVADRGNNAIRTLTENKEITVCPGTSVDLDATSSNANAYQWFFKGSPIASTPNVTASDSGWYVVRVENADACRNFDSVYVGYYTLPIANIDTTSRATGGPSTLTFCPSDSIVLTGNAVNSLYTYSWLNDVNVEVSTDTSYTVKTPGTYYLNITSDRGCVVSDTIVINQFTGSVSLGADTTTCRGVAHTFDAGTGFVSYLWQDGSTAQTFVSDTAGLFTVAVISTDGCTFSDSVNLAILIPDSVDITPDDATICAGDSALLTTAILGSSTGTYLWSDGATTDTNYVTTAGYAVVDYTDAITNCVSQDSILITIVAPPAFDTITVDSTICYNDTLPLLVRSTVVTDSVFIIAYNSLSNTRTIVAKDLFETDFQGVDTSDVGQYIYVVDNGICIIEQLVTINQTDLVANIALHADTVCYGDSIQFNANGSTGGVTPYTYTWTKLPGTIASFADSLQSAVFATPLTSGSINRFKVRVEDAHGCFTFDTTQVYLNSEMLTSISLTSGGVVADTIALCGDGTDQFTDLYLTVNGGLPKNALLDKDKYSILWYVKPVDALKIGLNGQGTLNPTIQTKSPIPDTITVYVDISDSLGCVKTDSVILKLRIINLALDIQHLVVCPGLRDSVSVRVVSGGTGTYSYRWFETPLAPATINDDKSQSTFIIPDSSKSYSVRVTDVNAGCSVYKTVGITVKPIDAITTLPGIICAGDTAFVDASATYGAVEFSTTQPYSHIYQWSKLTAGDSSNFLGGVNYRETASILQGQPGTTTSYRLVATDSIGCKDSTDFDIRWNDRIEFTFAPDTVYLCGNEVKQLQAPAVTGGVSNDNFTYNWRRMNGAINLPNSGGVEAINTQNPNAFFIPDLSITGISDTSRLRLRVNDTIGCTAERYVRVINNNLDFETIPTYDTTCTDVPNQITVKFKRDSNTVNSYVFNWYDPADASDLFVDALGTTPTTSIRNPFAITDVTNTYDLEITDNVSGCKDTAASIIYIFNIQPVIGVTPWPDDTIVACFGDDVLLTSENSTGGTPFLSPSSKYQYNWYRSSTTVDASAPVGITNDSSVVLRSNGSEGNHSIWVLELTDRAGCTRADSTTIYWNEPIIPAFEKDTVYVCTPDTAYLKVDTNLTSGGIRPYTITWSKVVTSTGGSAQLLTTIGDSVNVTSIDNDTTLFIARVEGKEGCFGVDTVMVIGVQFNVDAIASSPQVCAGFDDTLGVVISGDIGGTYNYNWTPATELDDPTSATPISQPTVDRTYRVDVYNSLFGCTATDSVEIKIVELTAIAGASFGLDTVIACFETSNVVLDGSLSNGGVPFAGGGYLYNWSTLGSTKVAAVGSSTLDNFEVTDVAVARIDTSIIQLIVQDRFGCIDTDYVAVYWNSEINAAIQEATLYSCTNSTATFNAVVPTGGTPNYTYQWSVVSGGATISASATLDSLVISTADDDISTIQLQISDRYGCTNTASSELRGVDFQIGVSAQFPTICPGLNDLLSVQIINDGTGPYTYSWTPTTDIDDITSASPVVNPLVPTRYTVQVIDQTTLCSDTASVRIDTVTLNAVAGATLGLDTLLRCYGDVAPLSLQGNLTNRGTAPYNYSWSSTDATLNFPVSNATPGSVNRSVAGDGSYSVVYLDVVDDIGCTSRDSVIVLWNSEIIIPNPEFFSPFPGVSFYPVCSGINTVIDGVFTGGKGAYSYSWIIEPDPLISLDPSTTSTSSVTVITQKGATGSPRITYEVTDNAITTKSCKSSIFIDILPRDFLVDLTVDEDNVCPNTTLKFDVKETGAITPPNPANVWYSWDQELTYVQATANSITAASTGYVKVFGIDSTSRCKAVDSVLVEVNPIVVTTNALTPDRFCYGESVTLSGTATGGKPGVYVYDWTEVPNVTSLGSSNPITVQPTTVGATTTYRLSAMDVLGCVGTSDIDVFRNDSILADAGNDFILCSNRTGRIGGSPTGEYFTTAGGTFDYIWTGGSSGMANIANPIFDPSAGGTRVNRIVEIEVEVRDQNTNCSSFDTILIDVRAIPYVNFAPADTFVCAQTTKAIYADGANRAHVYPLKTTFVWSEILSVANKTTLPFTSDSALVTKAGVYEVVVTDSIGCVNSDVLDISEVEQPLVTIRTNASSLLCTNEELSLEMIVQPLPLPEDTLRWTIIQGGGYIDNEFGSPTFYVPNVLDDTLEIQAEFINKCATGNDTLNLSVEEAPIADFYVTDSTVNITELVTFTNNSVSPQGNLLSYRWDFNAPGIESRFFAGPHDITYLDQGNFETQLVVFDNGTGCEDTATVMMSVNGTHLLYVPNVFSPNASNPENRTLKMYGFGLSDDSFLFTVYNRWGEKVYEQTSFTDATTIGWTGEYLNSGEPLDMGVYTYIVRAKYLDGSTVEKVGTITLLR